MMVLSLLLMCLVVSVALSSAQTVLSFCSGRSIHAAFSSKSTSLFEDSFNPLYLDGSDAAISSALSQSTGITSCTCSVKNGGAQIPSLNVRHLADGIHRTCGKSIDVVKFGEKAIYRFGCAPSELQFESIEEEGNLTVTLYVETPRPSDTIYKLLLEPEGVVADLLVTCWPPVMTKTTTSTSTSSSTSTTPAPSSGSSSTSGVISTTSSNNKVVLIGVVSAVMATVIVIMTCFLCFMCIRRRSKKKNNRSPTKTDPEKNAEAETRQDRPLHTSLYNTVSHIYASIRSNITVAGIRKKASLPKNALDRLRGRTKRDNGISGTGTNGNTASGFYDSIKSNSGNGNRMVDSDDVLREPRVDKMALTRHDSCESEHYIHAMPGDDSRPPMTAQWSTESNKYITPVMDNKEHRKVSVVPEEAEDSVNDNNKSDTEDYLEPIKTCSDRKENLKMHEDPYTVMNRIDGNESDKECYMTGRPRYLDSVVKDNSKPVENKMKDEDTRTDNVYANQRSMFASSINNEPKDPNMTKGAIPKTPLSVQPSGVYIPMNSSNVLVHAPSEEDLGYSSMKRDDSLTLCEQKGPDYIAMDSPSIARSCKSLPNSNTRDSGYEEPIITQNALSDKARAKSETTHSANDGMNESKDIFDLANIELGMIVKPNDPTESKPENITKPKVKRYVRKTENGVNATRAQQPF